MDEHLVSVIMPCYNKGEYLSESLEVLIRQTYMNWECIVMDDGSTDNSAAIALGYSAKEPRIKYFLQQNSGVIHARNKAIQFSKGKYILPLDADDTLQPKYIEKCMKTIQSGDDIKVVYGRGVFIGQMSGEMELGKYSLEQLLVCNIIHNSALHYKKDSERVGGYDAMMKNGLEDWEYWISILESGGKAVKIDDTDYYYRRSENSRSKSYSIRHEKELRELVYNKHKETYDRIYGDPIFIIGEKNLFADRLMKIRSNYLFKIFRRLGLLPKA